VADVYFSVCAGSACLAVAVLSAAKGVYVVCGIWSLLAVGFAFRAYYGWRRRRR
jgi:hypothetical protein